MTWLWKQFSELSAEQLYQAIQLREQVFVVEQKCVYLDCDDHDQSAWHLLGFQDAKLVAYLRAFGPAGYKYPEASFGRVVTSPVARGTGLGKQLTSMGIEKIQATFSCHAIRISAQSYLQKFYAGFGFQVIGDEYLEDNIPHVEMLLP